MTKKSKQNNLLTLPNGKLPYKLTNDYMFRAVFQSVRPSSPPQS